MENKVLDEVNLEFRKGQVHALLGGNGAGKSTLIKIILGVIKKYSGEIIFNGQKRRYGSTREAYLDGMAGIFQETSLVPKLTILENVFLGNEITRKYKVLDSEKMLNKFNETIVKLGLKLDPNGRVEKLSVADKKLVEIVKALIKNSQFIIMDEPTDCLPQRETELLLSVITDLKVREVSILYVTHKIDEVFLISDQISVLRDGKKIKTLDTSNTSVREVIPMMIGEMQPLKWRPKKSPEAIPPPILKTDGLSLSGILRLLMFYAHTMKTTLHTHPCI